MQSYQLHTRPSSPVSSNYTDNRRPLAYAKMFGSTKERLTNRVPDTTSRTTQSSATLCDEATPRRTLETAISFSRDLNTKFDPGVKNEAYSFKPAMPDQESYRTKKSDKSLNPVLAPKDNCRESHDDLVMFLQTTGPDLQRSGSKVAKSTRSSKSAFRFFRHGSKHIHRPGLVQPYTKANDILYDEGCLLQIIPDGVEQKFSSTGKRYLALKVTGDQHQSKLRKSDHYQKPRCSEETSRMAGHRPITPVSASRLSYYHPDDIPASDGTHAWYHDFTPGSRNSPVSPISEKAASIKAGAEDDRGLYTHYRSQSPARPAASNSPTPPPVSAGSYAESYRTGLASHPARDTLIVKRVPSKKPVTPMPSLASPMATPKEEMPTRLPSLEHPSPRRLTSHTLLSQRSSSFVEPPLPRHDAETPDTPPPKSPLRIRDNKTSEVDLSRTIAEFPPAGQHDIVRHEIIIPTVTTECTGPLSRPVEHTPVKHTLYPASRKEREAKTRARKLRDRPPVARAIDAVVCAPPPLNPHRRLKKIRPIQIPDISRRPSTKSNASRIQRDAPSTPRASQHSLLETTQEKTGYTPNSPTSTNDSASKPSPIALLAEQVPLTKTSLPKPARIVLSKERVYTPRPRSASMPKPAQRRSRTSIYSQSRAVTPEMENNDDTPPLPSPPPNRALPPTPPASGSERLIKKAVRPSSKDLPIPSSYKILAQQAILGKTRQQPVVSDINARLEALERKNRMLEAALHAVLATNGDSNHPLASLMCPDSPNDSSSTSWESRIARRSEASHAASSSKGSALEVYLNTKKMD